MKGTRKQHTAIAKTKPPAGLVRVDGAPDVSLTSGMSEEERKQRVCLMVRFNYLQSFMVNFTGDQTLYPHQPPLLQCQHRCETIYGQRDNQRVLRIELCFFGDVDEGTEKKEDNVKEETFESMRDFF